MSDPVTHPTSEPRALPCPFCGMNPLVEPWHGGPPTKTRISCPAEYDDECGATASATGDTRAEAIAAWNRRALPVPSGPSREEVEAAISEYEEAYSQWLIDGGCGAGVEKTRAALLALYRPAGETAQWPPCQYCGQEYQRESWETRDTSTDVCPRCSEELDPCEDAPAAPAGETRAGQDDDARAQFWRAVCAEIDHSYAKHGREPWGRHEFYAIMREEVDEVWDEIKGDTPTPDLLKEVVQVAAMCLRYSETGDRYRGPHPDIPSRALPPSHAGETE